MRAGQWVVRLRVMVEAPESPTVRVVTFAAFRAEASGVCIVGPVTRYAVQSRVLVGGIEMAFLARRRGVQTDQRKAGQVVIEEDFSAPSIFIVALRAFPAFLPFVHVVAVVAGDTGRRKFLPLGIRTLVTPLAKNLGVLAPKREFGGPVVVEGCLVPVGRQMAGGAIAPGRPLVGVDQLVARDTSGAKRFLRDVPPMAIEALQVGVPARQGELRRFGVIEADLAPVVGVVTGLAFRAIATLVRIIRLVAGDACRAELLLIELARMATVASDIAMAADQRERGVASMVEPDAFPFARNVASRTLRTVTSAVHVVQPVAVVALSRCALVALAGMATQACDVVVGAVQRELGLAVVESGFRPA